MPALALPTPLSTRALNRATLQRQWLLQRRAATPLAAIEHLVGLQAQNANPPYLALWSRLARFELAALTRLLQRRRVVRCALMRSTLHIVGARDLFELRALVQPVLERGLKSSNHARHLVGVDPVRLAAAARALLGERAMPTGDLGAALAHDWPGRDTTSLAVAARCHVPLVHMPPGGTWNMHKSPDLCPAETWLQQEAPAFATDAAQRLMLRYLQVFGPASVADFTTWCGLGSAAAIAASLDDRVVRYRDERGRVLLDVARTRLPDADTAAPARLLPGFDNLLLSHAERSRVIADADRARVFGANGLIRAVALVDGFVRATWRIERVKDRALLIVEPFVRLSASPRDELHAEALAWLGVAEPDATRQEVRIERPRPA